MVAELVCIGGLVGLGGDNLRRDMLGELDQSRLVDCDEVQVLAAGGLHKAAIPLVVGGGTGGDELAGLQRQLGIEPALGNIHNSSETGKHLAALGGIHILYQAVKGRGDEQIALLSRNLVLIHLCDGGTQGCHHVFTGGQVTGNLCNASLCGIAGKPERIQLRGNLVLDKLVRQHPERQTGAFDVVHGVHVEHTATVIVTGDGLVSQGYVALHVAAAAVVVAQALEVHDGDDELAPVGPLTDQGRVAVQNSGQRRLAVCFVQQRDELLHDRDTVCHKISSLSGQAESLAQFSVESASDLRFLPTANSDGGRGFIRCKCAGVRFFVAFGEIVQAQQLAVLERQTLGRQVRHKGFFGRGAGELDPTDGVFHSMIVLYALQLIFERLGVGVVLGFPVRRRLFNAVDVHVFVRLNCGIGVTELGFQAVPLSSQSGDGGLKLTVVLTLLGHDLLDNFVGQVRATSDVKGFQVFTFHVDLLPAALLLCRGCDPRAGVPRPTRHPVKWYNKSPHPEGRRLGYMKLGIEKPPSRRKAVNLRQV
nr:MAG TPA: hypothetical protein [Caudoviricetes sp.]